MSVTLDMLTDAWEKMDVFSRAQVMLANIDDIRNGQWVRFDDEPQEIDGEEVQEGPWYLRCGYNNNNFWIIDDNENIVREIDVSTNDKLFRELREFFENEQGVNIEYISLV
jgi:hypothetical protein